jgi:hypothetical protein
VRQRRHWKESFKTDTDITIPYLYGRKETNKSNNGATNATGLKKDAYGHLEGAKRKNV